ncbi:hypothetical protein [Roseateles terrae]|uniref:DUF4440 domain-containing protein n=1 Tax=Roseateles terrae TaxID=431060 RepID=A0ABR6GZ95_9BURK|nr:hypothetical protein [Roseateles terrae]MBB3196992.1 hypothetical protein [Roseateles terrae]
MSGPFLGDTVTQSVAPEIETRAIDAASAQPLWAEASMHAHCATEVFSMPKDFVKRMPNVTEGERSELLAALALEDSVVIVGGWTAERKPEPLTGGGKLYAFMIHPSSFKVLHAGVGTWRS